MPLPDLFFKRHRKLSENLTQRRKEEKNRRKKEQQDTQ
jgi:hypothetical protein